jgi:sarcosine oxidase subunit gamma
MTRSPLEPRLRKFPLVVSGREQAVLRLDDLSERCRFGCKGPGAESWLAKAGYGVPSAPNSALVDTNGVFAARLATSEFLVEALGDHAGLAEHPSSRQHPGSEQDSGPGARQVESSLRQLGSSAARPGDVYPVARQDLVVGIQGAGLQSLLRQICSVDFVPLFESSGADAGPVVLTSMVGVGVVAWPRRTESGSTLTLWLDPSFAHYFWTTLLEVGRGVGALVIGSNT